ncbi:MAG: DUF1592 domain-containing protein [Sandaracinus sp.]|nr:DUF1592 domain-containing protein [Sandaracinus sp.]MCB9625245.1 DUF1592 domain-containing protein [Sandaracinus sp.]
MRQRLAASLVLVLACSGEIDDPGGTPTPVPNGPPLTCDVPTVPGGPIRRLTRDQYDLTVRDLLGDTTTPARAFPADDDSEGFYVGGQASSLHVEQWASAAEALAERASMDLDALVPCDVAEASCADIFLEDLATRAYRRPATSQEVGRLRAVFDVGFENGGFGNGAKLVVQTILQSPNFLYHVELAPDGAEEDTIVPVEDYALASRLSYFLWASMPDDALLDAAAAGRLRTQEGLLEEATRMLADKERARFGARSFYRQWLKLAGIGNLQKNEELYPGFSREVAVALQASLELFLDEVFESGDLEQLYTSNAAYVNATVAPIFGLDGADFGEDFERVTLDATQRSGLVTHPALMALLGKSNQSDPIHRAVFVRQSLLCQHLPPPPADLTITAPDPAPGLSTRERFAEHSSNPACVGCHRLLDGVGFGFEHYDAVGAWRDEDGGRAVDASGDVQGTHDMDGAFDGAVELAHRLAESEQARDCVANQVFRFALQRVELQADACSLEQVRTGFAESGYRLSDLMLAVVSSDAFRFQRVQR